MRKFLMAAVVALGFGFPVGFAACGTTTDGPMSGVHKSERPDPIRSLNAIEKRAKKQADDLSRVEANIRINGDGSAKNARDLARIQAHIAALGGVDSARQEEIDAEVRSAVPYKQALREVLITEEK